MEFGDDEEMVPTHGMYGTLDAEVEVQRTIKSVELTAFLCLLRKADGPTLVHVDHKRIIEGLWRREMKCIDPRAKDADLWILIREELLRAHQEGMLLEGTSKRTAQRKCTKCVSLRKFINESSETADELAKMGAKCTLKIGIMPGRGSDACRT